MIANLPAYNLIPLMMVVCFLGCSTSGIHDAVSSDRKWALFQATNGGFWILMPGVPKETVTAHETPGAPTVEMHQFMCEPDATTAFGVIYHDLPPSLPYVHMAGTPCFFDSVQQEVLQKMNGKLISSMDIPFAKNQTRQIQYEFEFEGTVLRCNLRLIIVRRRQYQLIVTSQIGADVSKQAHIFFHSFRVQY